MRDMFTVPILYFFENEIIDEQKTPRQLCLKSMQFVTVQLTTIISKVI